MIFGTAKCLQNTNQHLDISFKGRKINNVTEYKYLGNIVDQHLNFNNNFEKVYKKASGRLKLLKKLRYYLTEEAAHQIYSMMIVPIITYRGPVKLSYSKTQTDRLKSLENRAKLVIGRTVPSIINSIKKEALVLVKKSFDNETCSNFNGYFNINQHAKATRNNGHLVKLPKIKLEIGKQTFMYSGAKLFNDLPLHIRKIERGSLYEKELRKYFNLGGQCF